MQALAVEQENAGSTWFISYKNKKHGMETKALWSF